MPSSAASCSATSSCCASARCWRWSCSRRSPSRSPPSSFADAAPLIPLTAAAMVWPALLRTVNQQTSWPGRTKATFIGSAVVACLRVHRRHRRAGARDRHLRGAGGDHRRAACRPRRTCSSAASAGRTGSASPISEVGTALRRRARSSVGCTRAQRGRFRSPPRSRLALAFGALYVGLLFLLRVVPESPLGGARRTWRARLSRAARTDSGRGAACGRSNSPSATRCAPPSIRAGPPGARPASRTPTARTGLVPRARPLAAPAGERGRRPGRRRRAPSMPRSARTCSAQRRPRCATPTMRRLLGDGADAADLRALEDLVSHLATVTDDAWLGTAGTRASPGRKLSAVPRIAVVRWPRRSTPRGSPTRSPDR